MTAGITIGGTSPRRLVTYKSPKLMRQDRCCISGPDMEVNNGSWPLGCSAFRAPDGISGFGANSVALGRLAIFSRRGVAIAGRPRGSRVARDGGAGRLDPALLRRRQRV